MPLPAPARRQQVASSAAQEAPRSTTIRDPRFGVRHPTHSPGLPGGGGTTQILSPEPPGPLPLSSCWTKAIGKPDYSAGIARSSRSGADTRAGAPSPNSIQFGPMQPTQDRIEGNPPIVWNR
ncbi:hypothetical protein GQ53DRAFT_404141 [Thozetella sp. PMI_491]|nr:hypothetical protein GQ53DRAFT_404141 [Thozetella sp. PMI_491]